MSFLSVLFFVSLRRRTSHWIRMSWHHSSPSNSCCQKPWCRPKYLYHGKNRRGKSHSSLYRQLLRCITELIQWQSIRLLSLPKNVPFPLLIERPLEFGCTRCKWIQVSEMQEEVQARLCFDPAYRECGLWISSVPSNSRPFSGLDWSFLQSSFHVKNDRCVAFKSNSRFDWPCVYHNIIEGWNTGERQRLTLTLTCFPGLVVRGICSLEWSWVIHIPFRSARSIVAPAIWNRNVLVSETELFFYFALCWWCLRKKNNYS